MKLGNDNTGVQARAANLQGAMRGRKRWMHVSALSRKRMDMGLSSDEASHLFDGMPPGEKVENAPPASGSDIIGTLPDHILHHLLSFLPVQAAVQTCVLARRWRHLWRSTTGLRIVGLDGAESVEDLRVFVDHVLILRERTDLDTVEMIFDECSDDEEVYVKLWTRFAVMSKVRALTLHIQAPPYLWFDVLPLVSRHLRTLDLEGLCVQLSFLDFAGCPALEDLKMNLCDISVEKISSRSLKHLSITKCCSDCELHVSTPGLVSLKLDDFTGTTPLLENMALLETAYVYIGDSCEDFCLNYDSGVYCGASNITCEKCDLFNDNCGSDLVLLGGISSAKHLKLISEFGKFIFSRDLKYCPTFTKLKTLLLNEYWCEAPGLDPLACILKNSPVLEKLTLQLFSKGPNHKVEMKGSFSSMERSSAIPEHLNIVEVKCTVVEERILKVLKFLCAFDIPFMCGKKLIEQAVK
uniref:F-box domain-containing protein n=1 Tax=Aegilops tauschii TaxID=37682 RepID=M8BWR9_AEGTA